MANDVLMKKMAECLSSTINQAGPRYTPGVDEGAPNLEIEELLATCRALAMSEEARDEIRSGARAMRALEDSLAQDFRRRSVTPALLAGDLELLAAASATTVSQVLTVARRRSRVIHNHVTRLYDECSRKIEEVSKAQEPDHGRRAGDSELEALKSRNRDYRSAWEVTTHTKNLLQANSMKVFCADKKAILLRGPWGSGKTHFACDFSKTCLEDGIPVATVLAPSLRTDIPLLDALAQRLGIATGNDLLAQLSESARKLNRRSLVIIDAINEADRDSWKSGLRALVSAIDEAPNVGLVLTCRTPFDSLIVPRYLQGRLLYLRHYGFDDQEFEAQQEFFAHYGIEAPHIPLITPEFSRPLFLKMVCRAVEDVSKKKQHRQLTEIASGQRGMTFLLEKFANTAGKEVEAHFSLSKGSCWRFLKGAGPGTGVAGLMASRSASSIYRAEVEKLAGDVVPPARSSDFVSSLVSSGLLADGLEFVDGVPVETLQFPYQRFGDHIIARHLLSAQLDTTSEQRLRRCFHKNQPLGAVFEIDDWSGQFAEPGIASAIMIEFPERVKNTSFERELVWHLPKARQKLSPFAEAFIDGLYWRSPGAFSESTDDLVSGLIDSEHFRAETLEVLIGLAARPEHPYNASRLWSYLERFPMPDRDLQWSEHLRTREEHSNIDRLLAWIERVDRPTLSAPAAANEVRLLSACLTAVDRPFRDRCTRALVFVGEQQPEALFGFVPEALKFNDPYVAERVIAAAYGVAMRRWGSEGSTSDFTTNLRTLVKYLIVHVIDVAGPHFTFHTLVRGYVVGLAQILVLLRPRALSAAEKGLLEQLDLKAPSPFSDQRSIGDEILGTVVRAFHMDFENYTIGRLVDGRRNYDMEHEEWSEIRRQIGGRIHDLGYSHEKFEKIDRRINESQWNRDGGNKVDRYGKKYSWIAYFEMFGLREAQGLLREDRERTSDCDIDPSFPSEVQDWNVTSPAPVSAAPTGRREWLRCGPVPDIARVRAPELPGGPQHWVLFDANWTESWSDGRELRISLETVLATSANIERIRKELAAGRKWDLFGFGNYRSDYYTYHGEVPWSPRYGADVRTPSGRPLSAPERAFAYHDGAEWRDGVPVEVPYRSWSWESYHSALNQVGTVTVPAPRFAAHLGLRCLGGSSDFLDADGQLATVFRRLGLSEYKSDWVYYVRSDLVERYCEELGLKRLTLVGGERTFDKQGLAALTDEERAILRADENRISIVDGLN